MTQTNNKERQEMKQTTKKEYDFLTQIIYSEFSEWVNESGWTGDWVCSFNYDMKVTRGLMSSLDKKGIIDIGGQEKSFQGPEMTWVSVKPEFLDFENGELKNINKTGSVITKRDEERGDHYRSIEKRQYALELKGYKRSKVDRELRKELGNIAVNFYYYYHQHDYLRTWEGGGQ